MRTLLAIAAVVALAACSQETATTAPDTAEMQTPAAPTVIVLTESDARTRLETAGYTDITGLVQNPDGTWTAVGTREGTSTQLSIGEDGVTVVTTTQPG